MHTRLYLNANAQDVLWPRFKAAWLLSEHDGFVALDKPVGIASLGSDPQRRDGFLERAEDYLRERHGKGTKLYPVQRLDAETSGVMIAATHQTRAAELSKAFEKRAVRKTYIAGIHTATPHDFDDARLEHVVHFTRGRSQIDPKRGKPARCHSRLLQTHANRALLQLELETGRTHQLRVQLAHEGAPIAGDGLYGGQIAPRLMLHASALALDTAKIAVQSTRPREMDAWLHHDADGELPEDLMPAVEAAFRRRFDLADGREATAFRCIHGAGDGLPGLYLDIYGTWGLLHLRSDACAKREPEILQTLAELPFQGLYIKRRPKQANRMGEDEVEERAPRDPIFGDAAPENFEVWEHDLPFQVSLAAGMSTGIFLDQRANRDWIRQRARNKRVLNLFSYTCGFGAAALAGGAKLVINVDASKNALQWAEANLQPYSKERWKNFADDVFVYLRRASRRGDQFDIIVVDPPTYATTKTSRFRSGKDWQGLVKASAALLAPGGVMLCCSNDERMSLGQFRKHLQLGLEGLKTPKPFRLRDRLPARDVRNSLSTEEPLRCVEVAFGSEPRGRRYGTKKPRKRH